MPGSLSKALTEAGIVLQPGQYVTADQYDQLPQWFRDEMEAKARKLVAERFGGDSMSEDT